MQRRQQRSGPGMAGDDQFRLLVEAVKDYAIFLLDPDGRVVSWNAGAERIKGYTADEILGQEFTRFYEPDDIAAGLPATMLARAAAEGRTQGRGWRVRKDGRRFYAQVTITALFNGQGGLIGYAKITQDVTAELEADDALAGAAAAAADDPRVEQVVICTPDKDLGQCVRGGRVVQLDRRNRVVYDEAGVTAKFGVAPASIPDYLALVGDSADGYPGLPGWGARSAAAVLAHYGTIEAIPDAPGQWAVAVRNRPALAATLRAQRRLAMLFKDLATLRVERSLLPDVDALRWAGPTPLFGEVCQRIDARPLATAAARVAGRRRP
jgi:PAS domain S-box-containing protein